MATAAVIVGVALALGVLIGTVSENGTSKRSRYSNLERERATPEGESRAVGELPLVEKAARHFLAGYLPLAYGKPGASADELDAAAPDLVAQLRADPGRVTPAQQQQDPRIVSVAVFYDGSRRMAAAAAQVSTGKDNAYVLTLRLERTPNGWQVTRLRD